jgi:1-phosphofructokinase
MIVTLTPNPSLDRTIEIPRLERGAVIRAEAVRVDAGGKGVNVTRALVANGHRAAAVAPVGGYEGDQFGALLAELSIELVGVPVAAPLRVNVSVIEPDGITTKLNAPGPELSSAEATALVEATLGALDDTAHAAEDTRWLAACGSLPPGLSDDFYADLVKSARDRGARVAVDTSGPAFTAALRSGPDVVKPNDEELEEVTGRSLATFGDIVGAAHELREQGVGSVVVSLGAAGAILVDAEGEHHADTPPVRARSTVGAGDALLAGFLSAGGAGPDALRHAVAWGAAAAALPGTVMPRPQDLDLDAVRLGPIDPDRNLRSTP